MGLFMSDMTPVAPVTSTELARRLGLSQGTVSRALAGNKRISTVTRERVKKAAKEMHYVSNAVARSLVRGKSNLIGLLSGGLQVERTANELIALDSALREKNLLPYLFYTRSELGRTVEAARHMLEQMASGLLILGIHAGEASELQYQSLHRIRPTVFIDSPLVGGGVHRVIHDFQDAYGEVIALLRAAGRRYPAVVHTGGPDYNCEHSLREDPRHYGPVGVLDAFGARGNQLFLPSPGPSALFDLHDLDKLRAQTRSTLAEFIDARPERDAFICTEDGLALCVISLLAARGRRVPEEVSVIGFGGDHLGGIVEPGLTSVAQQPRLLAKAVVDCLEAIQQKPDRPPRTIRIPGRLIRRGTL